MAFSSSLDTEVGDHRIIGLPWAVAGCKGFMSGKGEGGMSMLGPYQFVAGRFPQGCWARSEGSFRRVFCVKDPPTPLLIPIHQPLSVNRHPPSVKH